MHEQELLDEPDVVAVYQQVADEINRHLEHGHEASLQL